MRNSFFAVILALVLAPLAEATQSKVVVDCTETRFSDLVRIQIEEGATAGQYRLVQTFFDGRSKMSTEQRSEIFGMDEIEKSEFPALKGWNGYSRTLVRHGRANYGIEFHDECSGSFVTLECSESF